MFNLKKAVIAGIMNYALIFLIASALMFVVGIEGMIFNISMVVLVVIMAFAISKYYYFKGLTIVNPLKEGLMFGITFAVVTFLIEAPVMVYGFAVDQGWNYFMNWNMAFGYLLIIVVPVIVAKMK